MNTSRLLPDSPPVLVLGGGISQVSLIHHIRSRGIPTLVADYREDCMGHRIADHVSLNSTFDLQSNLDLAREFGIRGVIASATDQPLVVMADIAAELGLPCYLTPDQARLCTDKLRMLSAFADHGLPVPGFEVLDGGPGALAAAERIPLPVVVKPVDSQGQRGISIVRDPAKLHAAIEGAADSSSQGGVIVQRFITGPEVTVTGWSWEGRFALGSVTDRHTFNRPPATGVCLQHVYPTRQDPAIVDRCRALAQSVCEVYGLAHGPLYMQCIVDGDDVWIVEATCRLGGGHDPHIVTHATGLDFDRLMLELCLSGRIAERPSLPPFPVAGRDNLINFLLARPGVFATQELATGPKVLGGAFYHEPGYHQDTIANGLGRVGYLHCRGDSRDDLLNNARAAYDRCRIVDGDGNNLLFWPDAADLNL